MNHASWLSYKFMPSNPAGPSLLFSSFFVFSFFSYCIPHSCYSIPFPFSSSPEKYSCTFYTSGWPPNILYSGWSYSDPNSNLLILNRLWEHCFLVGLPIFSLLTLSCSTSHTSNRVSLQLSLVIIRHPHNKPRTKHMNILSSLLSIICSQSFSFKFARDWHCPG